MLVMSNNLTNYVKFKGEFGELLKSERVLITGNTEIYTMKMGDFNRKFYSSSLYGIVGGKAFGLAYMEQNFLNSDAVLTRLGQIVDKGIVFKYTEPYSFSNFFSTIYEYKNQLIAEEVVKEENNALKERYKLQREAYRERRAQMKEEYEKILLDWKAEKESVKEANKTLLAEWQIAYDKADESLKKFISKPEEIPEPKKPEEPDYGEKPTEPPLRALPRVRNIREERLDNSQAFRILRRFKYCKVDGTEWGIMIKRDKDLSFTSENIRLLSTETISLDEFKEFLSISDKDFKNAQNITQSFFDYDTPALVADIDDSIFDLEFNENELEDIKLVPLTGIKPMFAASMLAGGIGEYFQEVILDGERIAIKGAMVKSTVERKTLLNGKEIVEVIESNSQKLGVYNTENFHFQLLG